jgi:hypothetical protein
MSAGILVRKRYIGLGSSTVGLAEPLPLLLEEGAVAPLLPLEVSPWTGKGRPYLS